MKTMSMKIKDCMICQIPHEKNRKANALANLASTFDFISDKNIPLEFFPTPSIEIAKTISQTVTYLTRMDDIVAYLRGGTLPSDKL